MTASRSREVVARALWNVIKANMSSTAGAIQENWSGNSTPTSMHKGAAAAMWRPMNAPMANHGFVALPACTVAIPPIAFRPMAPHSHGAVAASPLPCASQTSRAPFRQRVRPFGRRAVHQANPSKVCHKSPDSRASLIPQGSLEIHRLRTLSRHSSCPI